MNRQRRKWVCEVMCQLEDIYQSLNDIRDEEEEYMNNMPENLQGSDRYSAAEEAVEDLDTAITGIEDALESCRDWQFD